MQIDGLLLDIDGVLAISWEPIPGSIEALAAFRRVQMPVCLITNTTTHTRAGLAHILGEARFDIQPSEIVTAVTATADYVRVTHPGASVFLVSDGDATDDMGGLTLVDRAVDADVVVLGGASEDFSYRTMNDVFRRLMDGVPLIAMHRNLYWKTAGGWELDAGPISPVWKQPRQRKRSCAASHRPRTSARRSMCSASRRSARRWWATTSSTTWRVLGPPV